VVKRDTVVSVVSPGSPTKKQFSPAGVNAATAFAKFSGKTTNTNRAANMEKRVSSLYMLYILKKHLTLVHNLLQFTSRLFGIVWGGFRMCFNSPMILS
jgi:hypothetical protein